MLALLIWALAVYGLLVFVWKVVRYIKTRYYCADRQMTLVLLVCDAEAYMEGILRILAYRAFLARKDLKIVVVDAGSVDATCKIITRMQKREGRLQLVETLPDGVADAVKNIQLAEPVDRPLCLFDLRGWENPKQIIPSLVRIIG